MARIARVVVPNIPHHITQRGNRRMETFFADADYQEYLQLMARWCDRYTVQIWAYCLMPNHVHLIATPASEDGLRRSIGEAHRCYTRYINSQKGWKGYLWQGRFSSFPMDEKYLIAAARYIELNPVRAGIVREPEDYRWSSCRAHLQQKDDALVSTMPLLDIIPDWQELLTSGMPEEDRKAMHRHERTGRPLGNNDFVDHLEQITSRSLKKEKPGPKRSN